MQSIPKQLRVDAFWIFHKVIIVCGKALSLFCIHQLHQCLEAIHLAVADMGGRELVEEFLCTGYLASLYLAQVEGWHAALGLCHEIDVLHRALLKGYCPVGRLVAYVGHRGRYIDSLISNRKLCHGKLERHQPLTFITLYFVAWTSSIYSLLMRKASDLAPSHVLQAFHILSSKGRQTGHSVAT